MKIFDTDYTLLTTFRGEYDPVSGLWENYDNGEYRIYYDTEDNFYIVDNNFLSKELLKLKPITTTELNNRFKLPIKKIC